MGKKILFSFMFGIILTLSFYTNGRADFYFSVDIPFYYNFSNKNSDGRKYKTDTVSGVMYHFHFTDMFGLGYETYEVRLKDTDYTLYDQKVSYTFYDLEYVLEAPVFILALGVGIGETKLICTGCENYFNKGRAMQAYVRVGYPVLVNLDIHVGYHYISSRLKARVTSFEADLSGSVLAIGVGIGF